MSLAHLSGALLTVPLIFTGCKNPCPARSPLRPISSSQSMALFFPSRRTLFSNPAIPLSLNHNSFLFLLTSTKPASSSLTSSLQFLSPRNPLKKALTLHAISPNSSAPAPSFTESKITDFGAVVDEQDLEEDLATSPWEGAVVYRRDAAVTHVEYSTTLERLGLAKLSSVFSKSRASAMGMRLPAKRASDLAFGDGTPVLVSIDVTRRKRRLRLDGILRTVITLGCNRCAEPAAESIFSNFTLLLTEDTIERRSDEIKTRVLYGQEMLKSSLGISNEEVEDDEKEIDEDDILSFPVEEKEIDISKQIRDLVHVEITLNAICNTSCKGLCLKCGTNLNEKNCNCREVVQGTEYGPLRDLRNQMQKR